MAAGDQLYKDGDPVYDSNGDPVIDDGSGDPCGCCGCFCCDEYDVTFGASWAVPYGGNTFRVVRTTTCDDVLPDQWEFVDETASILIEWQGNGYQIITREPAPVGNTQIGPNCDDTDRTLDTSPRCCPEYDFTGNGSDVTVTCVDAGGEEGTAI